MFLSSSKHKDEIYFLFPDHREKAWCQCRISYLVQGWKSTRPQISWFDREHRLLLDHIGLSEFKALIFQFLPGFNHRESDMISAISYLVWMLKGLKNHGTQNQINHIYCQQYKAWCFLAWFNFEFWLFFRFFRIFLTFIRCSSWPLNLNWFHRFVIWFLISPFHCCQSS